MDAIFEGESPRARLALLLQHFSKLEDNRESHDRRKNLKALHTLSAYATTARLVLAQTCVPEKTNEITAIPDLLDELAETGQLPSMRWAAKSRLPTRLSPTRPIIYSPSRATSRRWKPMSRTISAARTQSGARQ